MMDVFFSLVGLLPPFSFRVDARISFFLLIFKGPPFEREARFFVGYIPAVFAFSLGERVLPPPLPHPDDRFFFFDPLLRLRMRRAFSSVYNGPPSFLFRFRIPPFSSSVHRRVVSVPQGRTRPFLPPLMAERSFAACSPPHGGVRR